MRDMLLGLGASSYAVEKWIPSTGPGITSHLHGAFDSSHGDLGHLGEKLCRQQLLPGKELEALSGAIVEKIHQSLHWHTMSEKVVMSFSENTRRVSLLSWCREVLLDAATRSFFGERLTQIDPDMYKSFYTFDELSWKLHFGYPKFLARRMYAAKDKILDAIDQYLRLPKSERKGECWLIDRLETEMRNLGIDNRDIAAIMMPLYWVYASAFIPHLASPTPV